MHEYHGPIAEAAKREGEWGEPREVSPFWTSGIRAYVVGAVLGVVGVAMTVIAFVIAAQGKGM